MTLDVLKRILAEEFDVDPEEITTETNFYDDLSADSLDMVEMVMDMEEELGVDFEMEGEMKLETLGDLADFIEDKLAEME